MRKGYTFIELMLVVGIISLLAVVLLIYINPLVQYQRARDKQRKSDLAQIQRALEQYYNDNNQYPVSDANFQIVDASVGVISWGGTWPGYMKNVPKDSRSGYRYAYYRPINLATGNPYPSVYYLYTILERPQDDPGACPSNFCQSASGAGANMCKTSVPSVPCNYGVSSSNVQVDTGIPNKPE